MDEINYNIAELSKLKYVKITYVGLDDKLHEIKTEVQQIGSSIITLYFKFYRDFNINYPQSVLIKFASEDGLYVAESTLQKIEQRDNFVFFTIMSPSKMERRQNRKYYRINLKRTCVLIATDKLGYSSAYMSRLVDVSAGGVLIHQLESMYDSRYISIEPENFECFNIVLFLDLEMVLKLQARYVRQEKSDTSDRYAFEFINAKPGDIDMISKYVTKEQVERLKAQKVKVN